MDGSALHDGPVTVPGLGEASDELYAGDPADFVARRDALVRDARARKDRQLAEALQKLRRPTVGAWYVNLAVRAGLPSLRALLGLGRQMRDAQARLDFKALAALNPQRADLERRVLADLTAHLAGLGVSAAPAALDEVRSTLRAAVADAEAADAVESGRLERPLEYAGLGGFPAVAVPAGREPQEVEPQTAEDDRLGELERRAREAEAELAASRAALEAERAERERAAARGALPGASRRLAAAEAAVVAAGADRDRLAEELAAAEDRLAAAEEERAEAADAVAALERAADG